jgi:hypothetical protein
MSKHVKPLRLKEAIASGLRLDRAGKARRESGRGTWRDGARVALRLLKACDVHTLLRMLTGIFYAQAVKVNVLFFDKRAALQHSTASMKR